MFAHLFSYRLKCFLRDKPMIFWTIVYPLLLATLFQMAFANMATANSFSSVPIAVVDNAAYQSNQTLQVALQSASQAHKDTGPLFLVQETTFEDAERLLEKGTIIGYILLEPEIQMVVKRSGLNQSILKSFLDHYEQTASAIVSILQANPSALEEGLLDGLTTPTVYLQEVSLSRAQPDSAVILFYALLAMSCLFGAFWGIRITNENQADQSLRGARVNLAPIHKLKLLGGDILVGLLVQFVEMLTLLAYMRFALNVAFGSQLVYILLTCLAGSLAGVAMGTFIGALVKGSEGVKIGVVIGATMTMSLFSGLYYANIKYMVEKAFPQAAWINPAALVTDALYALYYYDTYNRFFLNIGLLFTFSLLFFLGAYLVLRRNQYASIPSLLQDN